MKIKQIVDKEGNLHILRFYNKGERYEIKKRNKAFCDAQHNQDLLLMRAFIKKRADRAWRNAYYRSPKGQAYYTAYRKERYKNPEARARLNAYHRAYYHSHKKPSFIIIQR